MLFVWLFSIVYDWYCCTFVIYYCSSFYMLSLCLMYYCYFCYVFLAWLWALYKNRNKFITHLQVHKDIRRLFYSWLWIILTNVRWIMLCLYSNGLLPHSAQRKISSYRMAEEVAVFFDLTSHPPFFIKSQQPLIIMI